MTAGNISLGDRLRKARESKAPTPTHTPLDPQEVLALRQRITGVLIRDARVAKGYDIEQVAALMRLPSEEVVAWEFGRVAPSLPQLELLAYWLEVPVTHFLSGTTTLVGQMAERQIDQDEYVTIRNHMIGAQMAHARQQAGFTVDYLAEQVHLPADVVVQYEYGQHPIPVPHLVAIASVLRVTMSYFLEGTDRVGAFIQAQELFQTFLKMNPEVREFVAAPANHAYIELAMKLAEIDTKKLRQVAEMLLEITL